jgi:DNA-binding PadR family transcriptional regulator
MPRHRRGWAMGGGPHNEVRHSPLTISMLEPALLTLINTQPRHGYTLLADLESIGITTIHPSVVYRTLREMEGLGWIDSDWDTNQTQGPPRRTYRLTVQGEEALQNWRHELGKTQGLIVQLLKQIEAKERS